jgi:hypothetical protein
MIITMYLHTVPNKEIRHFPISVLKSPPIPLSSSLFSLLLPLSFLLQLSFHRCISHVKCTEEEKDSCFGLQVCW